MEGWIKINRKIADHWLWYDAERLKWWFDLLFMAAWEDKKVMHDSHMFVLKRGQIIASVSFLVERWERSKPTIIKFLNMLEEDDMIKREVIYRQTPIITICNYERYQDNDSNDVYTLIDTQVNRQVDTIVDTIKENKEDKENKENITTSTSCVRAQENDVQDDDFLIREVIEVKKDILWMERMCMKYHIPSLEEFDKHVDDFILECQCNDKKSHINITDVKKHINNFLRKRFENKNKENNGTDRKLTHNEIADRLEQQAIIDSIRIASQAKKRV